MRMWQQHNLLVRRQTSKIDWVNAITNAGVRVNVSALTEWKYTYYDNGTVSNATHCYLAQEGYTPFILANGSWVNATSCFLPYYSIGQRGITGIGFAVAFMLTLIASVYTLGQFSINAKRINDVFAHSRDQLSRKWPWYWLIITSACSLTSCALGVDVERNYVQGLSIILQSAFFTLTIPVSLAMLWEFTRSWQAWQRRKITLLNACPPRVSRFRRRIEFYTPLLQYTLIATLFFMLIPRSWSGIARQRSPEQTIQIAIPAATMSRFKASAVWSHFPVIVSAISLAYALPFYNNFEPAYVHLERGILYKSKLRRALCSPWMLYMAMGTLTVRNVYLVYMSYIWHVSIFNAEAPVSWIFGAGFLPVFITQLIFLITRFSAVNDNDALLTLHRASSGSNKINIT